MFVEGTINKDKFVCLKENACISFLSFFLQVGLLLSQSFFRFTRKFPRKLEKDKNNVVGNLFLCDLGTVATSSREGGYTASPSSITINK